MHKAEHSKSSVLRSAEHLEPPASSPMWRSVGALAERLNNGAETATLSENAIRHHVRNASSNGLVKHIRRIGRKILINEHGYVHWLNSHGGSEK